MKKYGNAFSFRFWCLALLVLMASLFVLSMAGPTGAKHKQSSSLLILRNAEGKTKGLRFELPVYRQMNLLLNCAVRELVLVPGEEHFVELLSPGISPDEVRMATLARESMLLTCGRKDRPIPPLTLRVGFRALKRLQLGQSSPDSDWPSFRVHSTAPLEGRDLSLEIPDAAILDLDVRVRYLHLDCDGSAALPFLRSSAPDSLPAQAAVIRGQAQVVEGTIRSGAHDWRGLLADHAFLQVANGASVRVGSLRSLGVRHLPPTGKPKPQGRVGYTGNPAIREHFSSSNSRPSVQILPEQIK